MSGRMAKSLNLSDSFRVMKAAENFNYFTIKIFIVHTGETSNGETHTEISSNVNVLW